MVAEALLMSDMERIVFRLSITISFNKTNSLHFQFFLVPCKKITIKEIQRNANKETFFGKFLYFFPKIRNYLTKFELYVFIGETCTFTINWYIFLPNSMLENSSRHFTFMEKFWKCLHFMKLPKCWIGPDNWNMIRKLRFQAFWKCKGLVGPIHHFSTYCLRKCVKKWSEMRKSASVFHNFCNRNLHN